MLMGSIAVGVAVSISGYTLAWWLDVSIAGAMATMCGIFFAGGLVMKRLV
jgi:manganese/zinc/iron transport system permease protein